MKIVSSYFGNRILKHVTIDMRSLVKSGFTGVVHTFSENDLKYYCETFVDIVRISHEAGLDVDLDPWGVGRVFGGEAFSGWIAENPDKMQVSRDGTSKPHACLNNPEFRVFMRHWIDKAVETGTDGIFWDEPHLYISSKNDNEHSWTCVCSHCQKIFHNMFDEKIPMTKTEEVVKFQHWTLLDFLKEMLAYSKAKGMRNTLCLLPDEFLKTEPLDWNDVIAIPGIDILGTDPYWTFSSESVVTFVKRYSRRLLDITKGTGIEPQIWIQGFRIPLESEDAVSLAIETAASEGIENLAIWGFEACAHMSFLASGDPKKVWSTAIDTFKRIKDKS